MSTGKFRVTKTAWFGPKRVAGWGWVPYSWQGWAVTVGLIAALIGTNALFHGTTARLVVSAGVIIAFVLIAFVTGDPPGGPSQDR
jgi:hypothetical protein